jgi:ferredoxin
MTTKDARGAVPPAKAPAAAARLEVDWTACDGHGYCAELLPELVGVDEWGYPVVSPRPVPHSASGRAERAVADCPVMALRLRRPEVRRVR